MMKSTKSRLPNWRQVLVGVLIGVGCATLSGEYQRWKTRSEYDQHYSKLLELPSSISRPQAHFQRMPGVVGKALWIDFYQPNSDEDNTIRDWFVKHDGFSKFKSLYPYLSMSLGAWEAERGPQFLIMSREAENGWVQLSLGQRMTPAEADRDLATYPWKSQMHAKKTNRSANSIDRLQFGSDSRS